MSHTPHPKTACKWPWYMVILMAVIIYLASSNSFSEMAFCRMTDRGEMGPGLVGAF